MRLARPFSDIFAGCLRAASVDPPPLQGTTFQGSFSPSDFLLSPVTTLTASNATATEFVFTALSGDLYVNIHNTAYPAGVIRGQLGLITGAAAPAPAHAHAPAPAPTASKSPAASPKAAPSPTAGKTAAASTTSGAAAAARAAPLAATMLLAALALLAF